MCAPTALQVKPYHFDFSCSVRQRWFGQNIIDIFSRVGATAIAMPGSLCPCLLAAAQAATAPLQLQMQSHVVNRPPYLQEFPARDRSYYLQALADGRLRVEGCEVRPCPAHRWHTC